MGNKSPQAGSAKSVATREDRLKAALKANLQRRKAQARARQENDTGDPPEGDEKT